MLRPLLISLLIYSTALTATAQSTGGPSTASPSSRMRYRAISDWPDPAPSNKLPQNAIDIVTINQPTIRQHCHVHEVKADTITCRALHHRAYAVYQRDDILALIEPPAHQNLIGFAGVAVIVGATLAGSFFVPFAWCIALRVLSGIFFVVGWAANGETYDSLASVGYHDHNHDILLYQRPNTPLTIHLRTR
jgi:hypothetical protein